MVRGHIGTIENGSGATREHLKCLRGSSGASDTARGCLGSVQNDSGVPQESPKWTGGAENSTGRLGSD